MRSFALPAAKTRRGRTAPAAPMPRIVRREIVMCVNLRVDSPAAAAVLGITLTVLGPDAGEARGVVRVAAEVSDLLRIRADRPRERTRMRRVLRRMRRVRAGDELLRRDALLDPLSQREPRVVCGIERD